jgi:CHAT domain-containing protein/tetratricopeptide (TPR) repeat protein
MRILTVFPLFLFSVLLHSQSSQNFLKEADSLYNIKNYEEAMVLYHKVASINLSMDSLEVVADCKYQIAQCVRRIEGIPKMLDRLDIFISQLQKINTPPNSIARLYLLKAVNAVREKQYSLGLKSYESAISIYEQTNLNHYNVGYAYINAAQIYMRNIEHSRATAYAQKAISRDTSKTYWAKAYRIMGECSNFDGDYNKSYQFLKKGIEHATRNQDLELIYAAFAKTYLGLGNLEAADSLYDRAISYFTKVNDDDLGVIFLAAAELKGQLNQPILEKSYYEKGIQWLESYYSSKDRELAKAYCKYGDYLSENGNIDGALQIYHKAVQQVFNDFNDENLLKNPIYPEFLVESWALTASAKKGNALLKKYEKTAKLEFLNSANQSLENAIQAGENIKKGYSSEEAKLNISQYLSSAYEDAIQVNSFLFFENNSKENLLSILQKMEGFRANILEEAKTRNRSLILADIPDSLTSKEYFLRLQIADIQSEIQTIQQGKHENNISKLAQLRAKEDTYLRLWHKHQQSLKELFPAYKNYQDSGNSFDLNQTLHDLKSEKTLCLEYFVGERFLYVLGLSDKILTLDTIPLTADFDAEIKAFRNLFSSPDSISQSPEKYFKLAYLLFQKLIPQKFHTDLEGFDHLLIIPDGMLSSVPFEALITKSYSGSNFAEAPYLLHNFPIAYSWSLKTWHINKDEKGLNGKLVQFNPRSWSPSRNLSPLKYGNLETEALSGFLKYENQNATFDNFKKIASSTSLLHLSTHASADLENKEFKIEFSDAPLFLKELFAMNIPANLVVLSACETNVGEFKSGEGVMSLARGFAYAGSNSLIASLWQVKEKSTAEILNEFYKGLSGGENISKSLQQAKLKYLESSNLNSQKSPFYWAGLQFYGQDHTIDLPGNNKWLWWGLFPLLAGGFYFWRRYKKSPENNSQASFG